jgi:hypothetical protein
MPVLGNILGLEVPASYYSLTEVPAIIPVLKLILPSKRIPLSVLAFELRNISKSYQVAELGLVTETVISVGGVPVVCDGLVYTWNSLVGPLT